MFKMTVYPSEDFIGGVRDTVNMGTDVRFTFEEGTFSAIGKDVQMVYSIEQISNFEAWAI
jgi:hypothetical protein